VLTVGHPQEGQALLEHSIVGVHVRVDLELPDLFEIPHVGIQGEEKDDVLRDLQLTDALLVLDGGSGVVLEGCLHGGAFSYTGGHKDRLFNRRGDTPGASHRSARRG
jgi:hypothetical protein